jgi:hypothetical protein
MRGLASTWKYGKSKADFNVERRFYEEKEETDQLAGWG